MKKYPFVFTLLLATVSVQAQDYQISFAGAGESASVGTVLVENLTQGKSISLSGAEVLHLMGTVTGLNPMPGNADKSMHIYPNPMTEYSRIEFVTIAPGLTNIELFDITGKKVAAAQNGLTPGNHSYIVSGLQTGIYAVRISSESYTYTGKMISKGLPGSAVKVSYGGNSAIPVTAKPLKSAIAEKTMQYTKEDVLKITGSSGKYSTIMMDVPTGSKTLTFTFTACSDADGNNYPVVKVGNQWWMAGNLKTTKLSDGAAIPAIKNNTDWIKLTTSGYCLYNNDSLNKNAYGALYNWFTVNTGKLAPAGWHVPTDAEWTELTAFLGDLDVAGGKMKETGMVHWNATNTGATNTSGFTGLPGGYRDFNGYFKDLANRAVFWSATVANTGDAWLRELNYTNDNVSRFDWYQIHGYAVRCIRDQPATTPNPLNVVVSLDAQLTVSSTITTAGGTITATGADGTKYTLTFPKGALFGKEVITITPIAGIAGLHFSGPVVGGVQLAPEGLRLLQAAILTIESPKVIAASGFETVAFGYDKNGEDLFLNLPEIKGNKISMEIWHFSGGAAAQATPAEVQTHYNQYIPSSEENAFCQRVAEYIGRQRQAQLLGLPEDPVFWETMEKIAREGYDKFVAPLLPVALNDCAKAPAILSRALGCASQMARFGRSKEKRSDARLIVLALVVNPEGFIKYSTIYEGNKADCKTLVDMIDKLRLSTSSAGRRALVVFDAGIATDENLKMVGEKGYDYLCVARSTLKNYTTETSDKCVIIKDKKNQKIELRRVSNQNNTDYYLKINSESKRVKESAMNSQFRDRFEAGLEIIENSLHKKSGTKKLDKVHQRIGRLKEKYPSIHRFYQIDTEADQEDVVTSLKWSQKQSVHPDQECGVYFLRTSLTEMDEELVWTTYNTIREIESTFRVLKSDLDLRPVFHQNDEASMAHLHLGLLAYWVVNTIRYQLKQKGIKNNWRDIVRIMNTHKCVTTIAQNNKDEIISVRKCSEPTDGARQIYDTLKYKYAPFVKKKSVVLKTELKNQGMTINRAVMRN